MTGQVPLGRMHILNPALPTAPQQTSSISSKIHRWLDLRVLELSRTPRNEDSPTKLRTDDGTVLNKSENAPLRSRDGDVASASVNARAKRERKEGGGDIGVEKF